MVLRRAAFLALAVVCCCTTVTGCARKQLDSGTARIGMVTDTGGLGDRSFNDSAYAGLVRAKNDLRVDTTVLQSRSAARRRDRRGDRRGERARCHCNDCLRHPADIADDRAT
jgi:basic membrane lipoprotein Med (substrate-binding protein (PBP1-ABC) superfamily)